MYSVRCTGYPGGYSVSRGPSIFLDKKGKGRVPPLPNLSKEIEGPLHTVPGGVHGLHTCGVT